MKKKLAITAASVSVLLSLSHCGFGAWGPISDYQADRDRVHIIQAFERDRYWLTAAPDTKIEYYLARSAPDYHPQNFGKLKTKVLRENNIFAGFISYWMKTNTHGIIKFVWVEPEFRGKKFGEKLVRYALDDLCAQGAKKITLLTRLENKPAQKVYETVGFSQIKKDTQFVYYAYYCVA